MRAFLAVNALLLAGALASAGFFWAWWTILEVVALPDELHRFFGALGAIGAVITGYLTLSFLWRLLSERARRAAHPHFRKVS